ncbi:MAG: outer membrane beta-barrel protein [Bacteroidales bacterium]|nr:outer membrane beta-barrel protein [Bacteroidales bacterium]
MKRFICISIAALIALPSFSQEEKLKELETLENTTRNSTDSLNKKENLTYPEKRVKSESSTTKDTVIVEVGDEIFSVKEIGDETRVKIGKKEFRVVEDEDGVVVFKGTSKEFHKKNYDRFKGHIGGFELGLNSLLTDFWSTSLNPGDSYMDLNTAKSYTWNFSLPCVNIGFTKHFGIAATLGLNFNKYRFDGNNSIIEGENGIIGPYNPPQGITYSKSKLVTTYATLPLILEAQIPLADSKRTINIGAGVIGAAKLGSHTKVVYYSGGKEKEKHKDDFSLNTFRWGATGRIGYEFFQLYGTCYFTSMFEKGKGPELYPFEVGIAFTFND